VFIAQLRKKIERDMNRPEHIVTESGVGYRFIAG
jgi:two-component system, OmpR family, KDP operon response regulator KdpE